MIKWSKRIFWLPAVVLALVGLTLAVMAQSAGRNYLPVVLRGPISAGALVVKINFQPAAAEVPPGYDAGTAPMTGAEPLHEPAPIDPLPAPTDPENPPMDPFPPPMDDARPLDDATRPPPVDPTMDDETVSPVDPR